jgi:hypothetical protein
LSLNKWHANIDIITQLRFLPALLEKITEAAQKTDLSKAYVMCLALETGLQHLCGLRLDLLTLISQSARLSVASFSNTATLPPKLSVPQKTKEELDGHNQKIIHTWREWKSRCSVIDPSF